MALRISIEDYESVKKSRNRLLSEIAERQGIIISSYLPADYRVLAQKEGISPLYCSVKPNSAAERIITKRGFRRYKAPIEKYSSSDVRFYISHL